MRKELLTGLFLSLTATMLAHPAIDVSINPDYTAKTIEVVYKHVVTGGKDKHFIDEVKIKLNGKQIITQILSIQDGDKGGVVKYLIPELKNGDTIVADTRCNKGGNKSGQIGTGLKEVKKAENTKE